MRAFGLDTAMRAWPGTRPRPGGVRVRARMSWRIGALCAIATGWLIGPAMPVTTAAAQSADTTASFVTPFPEKDKYKIFVFGDSIGDGVAGGIAEAFKDDAGTEVVKKTRAGTGFVRPETFDWVQAAREITAKDKVHIAVMVIGVSDRQPIRTDKKRLLVGSDEWKGEYGRRVDQFLRALRKSNTAVYWVGLPVMKVTNASEDMQMINGIIREKVYLNGGKFIDTWNGFTDENGQYNQYGPDLAGKVRLLRDSDGMHFTKEGYRKLTHYVEREVRRDIAVAKTERSVPLAGGEAEQRRVNPDKQAAAVAAALQAQGATASAVQAPGKPGQSGAPGARPVAATRDTAASAATADAELAALEQKADTSKVTVTWPSEQSGKTETVTIEIVRPSIPAQVIAHVQRRASAQSGPTRAAVFGESLTSEIATKTPQGGRLTLMSSITTASEGAGVARRAQAPTQTPQYKLLVKGEQIPFKPGRADDFRWPKPGVATGSAPRS